MPPRLRELAVRRPLARQADRMLLARRIPRVGHDGERLVQRIVIQADVRELEVLTVAFHPERIVNRQPLAQVDDAQRIRNVQPRLRENLRGELTILRNRAPLQPRRQLRIIRLRSQRKRQQRALQLIEPADMRLDLARQQALAIRRIELEQRIIIEPQHVTRHIRPLQSSPLQSHIGRFTYEEQLSTV